MPTEVVVSFKQGIGNRLFQLAAGIALAKHVGAKLYARYPDDNISKALRSLVGDLPAPAKRVTLIRLGLIPAGSGRAVELGARAGRLLRLGQSRRLGWDWQTVQPNRRPTRGPLAIDGFAQHPAWFGEGVAEVAQRIIFNRAQHSKIVSKLNDGPVINLRRGDYVQLGWNLNVSYYRKGLKELRMLDADALTEIEIVGDDPMACAGLVAELENFDSKIRTLTETRRLEDKHIRDFWRIAVASSVVMSNSTFCWWATVVGDYLRPRRPVIFPADWIGKPHALHRDPWIRVSE